MKTFPHASSIAIAICAVAVAVALCVFGVGAFAQDIAQNISVDEDADFAPAQLCMPMRIEYPVELRAAPHGDPSGQPIAIEADRIDADADAHGTLGQRMTLRGDARIVQGRRGLYAERIRYDRRTYRAEADGAVVLYTASGDALRADSLALEVDTFVGAADAVRIQFADRDRADDVVRARATAQRAQFDGDRQHLERVALTACAGDDPDVVLRARAIELDHARGIGVAKGMTLVFKGVPVFYFPAAAFPIDDRRMSGFLFPSIGYDDSGAIIEAPYYFNLAPNYDATVTPRLLSARGAQVEGALRYLGGAHRGELHGAYLPSDDQRDDDDRYLLALDHRQTFGARWEARVDWRTLSDREYLRDFADDADLIASGYVAQRARLDYYGDGLRLRARADGYAAAAEVQRADRPHERLPQLQLSATRRLGRLETAVDAEYTDFAHPDAAQTSGARWRVRPSLALPLRRAYGALVPRASAQVIRYALDDAVNGERSPSVTVPIFSLDGRLHFERALARRTQTLEPRLRYLHIPRRSEQHDFPLFDSARSDDASFDHYFRDNRFLGGDRVGDASLLALGLTSRILDRDGAQRLRASLGQVFHLDDREVGLHAAPADGRASSSGVLAEVAAAVAPRWEAGAFARWRAGDDALDAFRLRADYARDARNAAAIAYTYRRRDAEQINLSFSTPLAARWQLQGGAAYSLRDDATRSAALNLRYDGCCWALQIGAQRYLDSAGAGKSRFRVTVEFDDLGRIGSG